MTKAEAETFDPATVCSEGPFEVTLKVGMRTREGQIGTVEVGMGHGRTPTKEDIQEALTKAFNSVAVQGIEFMNRHDYLNYLMSPNVKVAVPGPEEFPNADNWRVLAQKPSE